MALNIQPDGITSDRTIHTALPATDARRLWEVSWLPSRLASRDNAIIAMALADLVGSGDMDAGHWIWPHVQGWAAELDLTGHEALTQIANPPSWANADWGEALDDPEATE